MKTPLTIDDLMVALVAALGYGYGQAVSQLLGWPELACAAASFVVGLVSEEVIDKIVFSEAVQSKPRNRIIVYVASVLFFVLAHVVSVSAMGVSMLDFALEQVQSVVQFTILGFVVNLIIHAWRVRKVREVYGDGSQGYVFDLDEDEIEEANQENQVVTDEYDEHCAIKTRTGTYVGEKQWMKQVIHFLGIPYATPPVEGLRWMPPQPLPASDAVFEAKSFGASAIQVDHKGSILAHHRQSEDCLTLNVYVNTQEAEGLKPVLVLFHEGDFTFGGSADPLSFGESFVSSHPEIVLVSFNYRLGIFGFIDFSKVPGGEARPDTQNLGLLDQVAALTWIKENIAAFGGDPDQISVLGFGAGASSICLLAATGQARDLFQRAFVFNGSPLSAYDTPDASRALARDLMRETQTSSMEELLQLDTGALKGAAQRLWKNMCSPTSDGTWIPTDAYRAYRKGAAAGIEFIVGVSGSEARVYRSFVGDDNVEDLISASVADIAGHMDAPDAEALMSALETRAAASSELEAKSQLAEDWNVLSILRMASELADGGSPVRVMWWDEKPLIENLGSGSVDAATTLIGNDEASQAYGNVLDEDLSEVLQALLVKFASGGALKLYPNEVKGVDAFVWEKWPMALVVSGGEVHCESVEEALSTEYVGTDPEKLFRAALIRLFRTEYLRSWGMLPTNDEQEPDRAS